MTFIAKAEKGKLILGEINAEKLRKTLLKNEGRRVEIKVVLPESTNQRKFYHGSVITIWVYLDGRDYQDSGVLEQQHQIAKMEFLGEYIVSNGKTYRVGKSSKRQLPQLIEKTIEYLEENYGIKRQDCFDTEHYRDFMDRVYPFSEFETYVDYLISLNRLPKI